MTMPSTRVVRDLRHPDADNVEEALPEAFEEALLASLFAGTAQPPPSVATGHRPSRPWSARRRPLAPIAAAALILCAVVTVPLFNHGQHANRPPTSDVRPGPFGGPWQLAGYISQPGWEANSGTTPFPTSQQDTTRLTCPTVATCYSDGTGIPNRHSDSQGVLSVSHDGGRTWRQVLAPGHSLYFWSIDCPTATTCVVAATSAGSSPTTHPGPTMFATHDGGTSWSSEPMPGGRDVFEIELSCTSTWDCAAIEEVQERSGIRSIAYATTNAGRRWTSSSLPSSFELDGSGQPALQCFANDRCIAEGTHSAGPQVANGSPAMIFSTDGGGRWTTAAVPRVRAVTALMSCPNAEHCVTIEFAQQRNGMMAATGVLTTGDGGQDWALEPAMGLTSGPGIAALDYGSLSCSTDSDCWAGGVGYQSLCQGSCTYIPTRGVLVATDDGGRSWSTVRLPPAPSATLQYGTIDPVACVTGATCLAVGTLELSSFGAAQKLRAVQQDVVLSNGGTPPP